MITSATAVEIRWLPLPVILKRSNANACLSASSMPTRLMRLVPEVRKVKIPSNRIQNAYEARATKSPVTETSLCLASGKTRSRTGERLKRRT